jgi:carbonic anhydrase
MMKLNLLIISMIAVITGCSPKNETAADQPKMFTEVYEDSITTPELAIAELKKGNERFVSNTLLDQNYSDQIKHTSEGQKPYAVVLACLDSRVSPEIVFDQGLGDIFTARVAGNIVNEEILGSMEYACEVVKSKTIVVMGHGSCGAVKAACDHVSLGNIGSLAKAIQPAVDIVSKTGIEVSSKNHDAVELVAEENVKQVIKEITAKSEILKKLVDSKQITIVGAMYDIHSGKVRFL